MGVCEGTAGGLGVDKINKCTISQNKTEIVICLSVLSDKML